MVLDASLWSIRIFLRSSQVDISTAKSHRLLFWLPSQRPEIPIVRQPLRR